MHYQIDSDFIDLIELESILTQKKRISLSETSVAEVVRCRDFLDRKLRERDRPYYGINTGFGSLYNVKIFDADLTKLQENLVRSHACGTGGQVPSEIVKIMLLLKILSLSKGYSGVKLETLSRLIDFYNHDVTPIVYVQGSLGASGDLSPLAHLSLPLIGDGKVLFKNEVQPARLVLDQFNWNPIELQSKEGLALLNGTQFMGAYGAYLIFKSYKLMYLADLIASISLEAFDGRLGPFYKTIQDIRPHRGQQTTAQRINGFLKGSQMMNRPKKHIQDPYSFRCIPQVHGASKDMLEYVSQTFATEINAVTDNPIILTDEDEIISGGNFHGQPLALSFDALKIAMSELANISERRTFQLVSGLRGLPAYLVDSPGLNSGFMIPQYTAASIVSANKQLATPASVDSIVSCNGQEDHVSMGANAATQAYDLIQNVERVLAIELMNASQAMYFRCPLKSSKKIESFLKAYRKEVPFVSEDKMLHEDIQVSIEFLKNYPLSLSQTKS